MSKETKKPSDNRTATQKIADLENGVMSLFQVNQNLTRDVAMLKDALKLLDNKLNSMAKALNGGEQPTDEVLTRIMTQNNVEELAQKVSNMVNQGFLVKEEQISENSFVVGSELDATDALVNPRLQFALKAIAPNFQEKLLGSKPGDVLLLEEGKLRFKVLESYLIQEPKAPEAAPAAEEVPEVAPEAAAEQTTAPASN